MALAYLEISQAAIEYSRYILIELPVNTWPGALERNTHEFRHPGFPVIVARRAPAGFVATWKIQTVWFLWLSRMLLEENPAFPFLEVPLE
jgi:hypothetical protein